MLLAMASLLLGAGAFNYVVDPFEKRDLHWVNFHREAANRNFNIPLWSVFSVGRIADQKFRDAEILVLGDSRATLLTNNGKSFRAERIGNKEVINLSIGGGSFKENITFFEIEDDRSGAFEGLKTVVFTAPFNRLCEPVKTDRIQQSVSMRANPWMYYFSGYIMKRSLVSLGHMGKSDKDAKRGGTKADGEKALAQWLRTYRSYDQEIADDRLEMLEDFVGKFRERGVEVIFYFPPGGGGGKEVLESVDLVDEFEEYRARLEDLGRVVDWSNEQGIDGVPFEYKVGDPIHHDKGVKILTEMIN